MISIILFIHSLLLGYLFIKTFRICIHIKNSNKKEVTILKTTCTTLKVTQM